MNLAHHAVTLAIRGLSDTLCQVNDEQLKHVPKRGPLILVCNHINFLDVPVLYTHLQPRPITGFAKAETWDSAPMALLFNLWGAIPIRRGEADLRALRSGIAALEAGKILAIAPEGTRSGHGCLQRGHPGVVLMALHTKAPLLPIVYYGGEAFRDNFKRLSRTDFHISVGQPFHLHHGGVKVTKHVRREMLDEIMYQLAWLLPEAYRGEYADISRATQRYLRRVDLM